MLEVKGFRGLRYSTALVPNLDLAITPPYDVITPEERTALAAGSPHNLVHLILPVESEGRDKYENAAAALESWILEGALVQDDAPSLYLLRQHFTDLEGNAQVRKALSGCRR